MSGTGRKLRDGLLAAGVIGALGFGAAGAFARPAQAAGPPNCDPETCNTICEARHGPFAHGECWDDQCVCAI